MESPRDRPTGEPEETPDHDEDNLRDVSRTDDATVDSPAPDSDGVTPDEAAALRRARGVSRLMDEAFPIPGTDYKIGLDPILGVLPVAGDAVSAVISLYPVLEAYRLGASRPTLAWMLGRVGVDAAVGSVPLLGGVFDALWKANERNVRTLEGLVGGD